MLIVRKEHSQSHTSILNCIDIAAHCEEGILSEPYVNSSLAKEHSKNLTYSLTSTNVATHREKKKKRSL